MVIDLKPELDEALGVKETKKLEDLDQSTAKQIIDEENGKVAHKETDPNEPVYYNDRINVLDDLKSIEFGTWKKVKRYMTKKFSADGDLFFVAHKEDEIVGKPQELYQVKPKVVLVTHAKKTKYSFGEVVEQFKYIFLDDNYDKRFDGEEHEVLGFHFWIYRVVENGIEYMVLSETKLDPQEHRLRGMKINLKDSSELTKTLKIKTISNLFIVVEDEPSIKPMPKKDLIGFVEELGITKEEYIEYLYTHPDKNVYSHTPKYSRIRVYQELSGKYEGYPLHLMIWGDVGRGKTMELECINNKFMEERGICEAGNSTLKALIPSYSEKPADMGHILKCLRRCEIDELNKMFSKTQNYEIVKDYLGQLNFLLEHKDREVGSGNSNGFRAKATAKITIATNSFGSRTFLHEHIGVLDETTLSRMLHLVVDGNEYSFMENNQLKKSTQQKINNEQFLSMYDSCQNFLVSFDEEKVREIVKKTMDKSGDFKRVWKPRGVHHAILLLDGITKFRCLFDGDTSFRANARDYEELENVLNYIFESWTYPLKSGWNNSKKF